MAVVGFASTKPFEIKPEVALPVDLVSVEEFTNLTTGLKSGEIKETPQAPKAPEENNAEPQPEPQPEEKPAPAPQPTAAPEPEPEPEKAAEAEPAPPPETLNSGPATAQTSLNAPQGIPPNQMTRSPAVSGSAQNYKEPNQ